MIESWALFVIEQLHALGGSQTNALWASFWLNGEKTYHPSLFMWIVRTCCWSNFLLKCLFPFNDILHISVSKLITHFSFQANTCELTKCCKKNFYQNTRILVATAPWSKTTRGSCGSDSKSVFRRFLVQSQTLQWTCWNVLEQHTEPQIASDAAPSLHECVNV